MGHGSKSGKSSSSAKNACYLMPARKKIEAKKTKKQKKGGVSRCLRSSLQINK